MNIAPRIAVLYALFACLAAGLLAPTMPPMQNADEGSHTYRADQVSHFGLVATRIDDGEIGGRVEAGLVAVSDKVNAMRFDPAAKVSRAMLAPMPWGPRVQATFANTAVYPPFFYLPAALMAVAARRLGTPLPHALVLMRLATAAVSIAISAAAIAIAGNAALWLFAVSMLPMTIALDAAVSQDGPMLACVALAVACHVRMRRERPARAGWLFACMCLMLTLAGMGRPPDAAFCVLALASPVRPSFRLAGLMAILAGTAAWSLLNASFVVLPPRVDGVVSPSSQLAGLLSNPLRLPSLLLHTMRFSGDFLAMSFIGVLGWLNVVLPMYYYLCASAILVLAALGSWLSGRGQADLSSIIAGVGGAGGGIIGVCLAEYLVWTITGAPVIDGLQGRYFLAAAMVFGASLARPGTSRAGSAWRWQAPVLAFPIATIAVTVHAVLVRYYV